MFIGFHSVTKGANHIEKGTPCQDAAISIVGKEYPIAMAIAADGHGGEKYFRSDMGSKFAVNATKSVLWYKFCKPVFENQQYSEELNRNKSAFIGKNIPKLEQQIIKKWREYVLGHYAKNPLNEAEIAICKKHQLDAADENVRASFYGSTLLAALIMPGFYFAIQIGDGLCVKIARNGKAAVFVPEDERLGFGETTSLCAADAVNNFRHSIGTGAIAGITVATDGVVDSFEREKYFEFLYKFRGKCFEAPGGAKEELDAFLPTLSERGSRDDCAIAGVWTRED
jgi:hypothetical protein